MMLVMVCDGCTRFRISPEHAYDARVTRSEARSHCGLTGHTVRLGDSVMMLVYELLAGAVLCERWDMPHED